MPATESAIEQARSAARAAADKLGFDIVALDVSGQLVITDVFVIVSANNERQVSSIVDGIEETMLKEYSRKVLRREGKGEGHWVLIDFGDIIAHVFNDEDRQFYALEKLWKDCPVIDANDVVGPPETSGSEQ